MRNEIGPVPLSALLEQRAWVARVARALVADPAAAEDLQQDVWLRSMERGGPDRPEATRSWLRTLLRRGARDQWRAATRRSAHEQAGARPEAVPGPDEVVARAETLRRVVSEVVALPEPFRTTLLLRFWEDLPPRAIAARLGVPVETVRSRTRRGLGLLRARLAGTHGGGGRAWLAAVLPLAHVAEGARGGAALSLAAKTAALGGSVMSIKVLAGGIALGAAIGAATTSLLSTHPPSTDTAALAEVQAEVQALREALRAEDRDAPELLAAASPVGDDARLETLERGLAETRAALSALTVGAPREKLAAAEDPAARQARFEAYGTDKLLLEIRKMVSQRGAPLDGAGILAATDVLLARGLSTGQRAEGLTLRGVGFRVLDDPDAERAAFEEAVEVAGPDSERGREARTQLAWSDANHGHHERAGASFVALAEHPEAAIMQRIWNRYYGASQFVRAGDRERARRLYQRVIDDHGEDTNVPVQRAVAATRTALARLDATD